MPETKTAVEWLFGETLGLTLQLENKRISHRNWELQMVNLFEQAKQMEKEQIIDAYEQGFADAWGDARYDEMPTYAGPEQYYNETYGENN
jgi:hypothetical protein